MLRLPFLAAPGHSAEGGQDGGSRGRGETASEAPARRRCRWGVLNRGQWADKRKRRDGKRVPVADAAGTQCWLVSGDGDRSAGLRSHRAGCSPICAVLGFVGRWQGGVWAQLTAGHSTHTGGKARPSGRLCLD